MGVENVIFSFGGELGNYATYKVAGIINSKENIEALRLYKKLYGYTPPGWGKAFFLEDNQAITEGLAAMSMNFFAFFPALANPATNKYAKDTGFFAKPAGPDGQALRGAGRTGHLDRQLLEEARKQSMKFLEWFVRDDVQKKWAELGGYTCNASGADLRRLPQGHALQRSLLPDHVHGQGLLGHARVRGAADARTSGCHPFVVGGKGTAEEALTAWRRTGKRPSRSTGTEVARPHG